MHKIDPESDMITPDNDSLYLYVNNDIEYGLFEDIVDSYYLAKLKMISNVTTTAIHNDRTQR